MAGPFIEKQEMRRASVRVKRVVDDECVTEDDFVGALAPVGEALPSRRLAVGHAVSQ